MAYPTTILPSHYEKYSKDEEPFPTKDYEEFLKRNRPTTKPAALLSTYIASRPKFDQILQSKPTPVVRNGGDPPSSRFQMAYVDKLWVPIEHHPIDEWMRTSIVNRMGPKWTVSLDEMFNRSEAELRADIKFEELVPYACAFFQKASFATHLRVPVAQKIMFDLLDAEPEKAFKNFDRWEGGARVTDGYIQEWCGKSQKQTTVLFAQWFAYLYHPIPNDQAE